MFLQPLDLIAVILGYQCFRSSQIITASLCSWFLLAVFTFYLSLVQVELLQSDLCRNASSHIGYLAPPRGNCGFAADKD